MNDADTKELVDINIPNDVLFDLMLAAHARDITLNQLVEMILRAELEKEQSCVARD